jgi:hypothetical protein
MRQGKIPGIYEKLEEEEKHAAQAEDRKCEAIVSELIAISNIQSAAPRNLSIGAELKPVELVSRLFEKIFS